MADKNETQQCGCSATPLPPRSPRQTTIDIRIDFCPLHAEARALLVALKALAKHAHFSSLEWEGNQALTAAREAIRKAEGKRRRMQPEKGKGNR